MKIIFLDIDGPMKPGRCSFNVDREARDGNWDSRSVDIINFICEMSDARIVFNSFWCHLGAVELVSIAVTQGIKREYILGTTDIKEITKNRIGAIYWWLSIWNDAPEDVVTHWVCVDDKPMDDPHVIKVDGLNGISVQNYREIMERFDCFDTKLFPAVHEGLM